MKIVGSEDAGKRGEVGEQELEDIGEEVREWVRPGVEVGACISSFLPSSSLASASLSSSSYGEVESHPC